jgi:hypothetical protein
MLEGILQRVLQGRCLAGGLGRRLLSLQETRSDVTLELLGTWNTKAMC